MELPITPFESDHWSRGFWNMFDRSALSTKRRPRNRTCRIHTWVQYSVLADSDWDTSAYTTSQCVNCGAEGIKEVQ